MKERPWTAFVIFLSGYSPLALILIVQDFNFATQQFRNPTSSAALACLAIASLAAIAPCLHLRHSSFEGKVERVQNRSHELLNYSLPYIVAFFGINLGSPSSWLPFVLFLLLIFYLTFRTQAIFINPILVALGYGLYEVDFVERGKTKHNIFLSKEVPSPGTTYNIIPLSPFLYLAKSKNNE